MEFEEEEEEEEREKKAEEEKDENMGLKNTADTAELKKKRPRIRAGDYHAHACYTLSWGFLEGQDSFSSVLFNWHLMCKCFLLRMVIVYGQAMLFALLL